MLVVEPYLSHKRSKWCW